MNKKLKVLIGIIGLLSIILISLSGCVETKSNILITIQNNFGETIEVGYNIDYGKYENHFYLQNGEKEFIGGVGDHYVKECYAGDNHTIAIWWGYGNEIKEKVEWFYNISEDAMFIISENGEIIQYY